MQDDDNTSGLFDLDVYQQNAMPAVDPETFSDWAQSLIHDDFFRDSGAEEEQGDNPDDRLEQATEDDDNGVLSACNDSLSVELEKVAPSLKVDTYRLHGKAASFDGRPRRPLRYPEAARSF